VKAVELEVLRHDDALVPQGVLTWVSPVQQVGIKLLTTLPEMHIAVTVDIQSTIKLWDCQNSEALATSNLESPCKLLKAVFTKDGPMVLVSDPLIWNTHTEQNTCQF
jgi:F-box/WD-40 domain protein 12/13/14/15/16/17/19